MDIYKDTIIDINKPGRWLNELFGGDDKVEKLNKKTVRFIHWIDNRMYKHLCPDPKFVFDENELCDW